jgi:hypothetical protein
MVAVLLAACGDDVFVSSPAWKETDKKLNCQQLQLEMNDARYWQNVAISKKQLGIKDVLWLPGYYGRLSNANGALSVTSQRLQYLGNIFKIKNCDSPYDQVP